MTGASKMAQQVEVLTIKSKDLGSIGEPTWWEESTDYCKLSCDLHKPTLRVITKVVVEFQSRRDLFLCITVNYDTCSFR